MTNNKKKTVTIIIIALSLLLLAVSAVIFFLSRGEAENTPEDEIVNAHPGQLPFDDIFARGEGIEVVLTPAEGKETWDIVTVSAEKQGKETLADKITREYETLKEASTPVVGVVDADGIEEAEEIPDNVIVRVENPNKEHVHKYETHVVEATCETDGYTEHVCSCGDSYTDTKVNSLGHQWVETVVAPTTTAQGYTEHKCSVCGASYVDNYVEALHTHSFTEHVVEATCEKGGYTEFTCECGYSYVGNYTDAKGHEYGNNPTCHLCGSTNPSYVEEEMSITNQIDFGAGK